MKASRPSWYTREDFKPIAQLQPLRERVSFVRLVFLVCGHSARLTGERALTPPKRIACFTCRCDRRDRENGPAPRAGARPVVRPEPTELRRA